MPEIFDLFEKDALWLFRGKGYRFESYCSGPSVQLVSEDGERICVAVDAPILQELVAVKSAESVESAVHKIKVGDVFAYMDEFVEGRKSDNFVVIGVDDHFVVCAPEFVYWDWFERGATETVVARHLMEQFREWYPTFLFNVRDKHKGSANP